MYHLRYQKVLYQVLGRHHQWHCRYGLAFPLPIDTFGYAMWGTRLLCGSSGSSARGPRPYEFGSARPSRRATAFVPYVRKHIRFESRPLRFWLPELPGLPSALAWFKDTPDGRVLSGDVVQFTASATCKEGCSAFSCRGGGVPERCQLDTTTQ